MPAPTLGAIPGDMPAPPAGQIPGVPSGGADAQSIPSPAAGASGNGMEQQAGLFNQLEQLHESVVAGKQVLMSIADMFPVTAEPVRAILLGVEAINQGMPTLVTAMTTQSQEPYNPSPMVLG